MVAAQLLAPDGAEIRKAITLIRPRGDLLLVSIEVDGNRYTHGLTVKMPEETERAVGWCIDENLNGRNVYFTCNVARPIQKKAAKADMQSAVMCWADCDPQVFIRGSYDAARKWLKDAVVPVARETASFIIDSGNGISPFWLLSDDADIQGIVERNRYESINNMMGEAMHGGGTQNCDRVMRMPGTINYPTDSKLKKGYPKTPSMARLLFVSDRRYSLEAIEQLAQYSDLKMRLQEKLLTAPALRARWEGSRDGLNDKSDSAMDMSMGSMLKKIGFSYEEAVQLLQSWEHSNATGREQGERYWRRIWEHVSDDAPPQPTKAESAPTSDEAFTLSLVKFDDLSTILEYPPRKWVFEEWLPYSTAALFHGQGGTGKTRLSLQAAIAAILLKNLFGWEPNVSGPVIFISGEEPADSVKRMVWEVCESFSLSPQERLLIAKQLHVIDLTQARSPILYTADGWTPVGAEVLARIRQLEPVLGVLDNTSSCYGGPATEGAHIYTFVNGYAAAFGEHGAGLLLSHENKASAVNKNREHAYGGVTTWHNACRARIEMFPDQADKNVRKLGRPKSNYAALMGEDDALSLTWHRGAWQPQVAGGLIDGMRRENNVTQVTEYVRAVLAVARDNVSPNPKARNNPIAIGRDYELACHVKGNAFWSALEEAVRRGFLKLEKYQKQNREWSERFIK